MQTFWRYLSDHWLSISIVVLVLLACFFVYKNRSKYIRGWDKK
ncbi:hypothetical protein [Paenibacillus roseipurpureus]|uniref:Uncharacterized protein n=1 Tax=Paenibacillus roseopurpureus TaxID=2918901 RepID=A0AA96LSG5_9BACL|nr:hypothetical protein [Paenibacillus sp. MBLB1832]WNR45088.1 hypothetical protein MJB10_02745 [Paenibacillus sp. MBLB1832]